MKTRPCYQCGWCCTVSPCGHGKWNAKKHQCDYLKKDSTCGKYKEIARREKAYPHLAMMGSGCSSPLFNERRDAKMKALGLDLEIEAKEIETNLGINLDFSPNFDRLWEKIEEDASERLRKMEE
jgi:hypothetical protein